LLSIGDYACHQISDDEFETILSTDYILNGILGMTICIIGIIANFASITLLSGKGLITS